MVLGVLGNVNRFLPKLYWKSFRTQMTNPEISVIRYETLRHQPRDLLLLFPSDHSDYFSLNLKALRQS